MRRLFTIVFSAALLLGGLAPSAQAQTAHNGALMTLGGGFNEPNGVAVDGDGNVFVADALNNAVKKIPVGCTDPSCVIALGGGFSYPEGVAVDGYGNVFVGDSGHMEVKKIPVGCTDPSCVIALGGGFVAPTGVAVDGDGNVFVADALSATVGEIPSTCWYCVYPLGGDFNQPHGVAVDGNGNVYVADTQNNVLKKMPASCQSPTCVTTLSDILLNKPFAVAMGARGNVLVADTVANAVKEIPVGCTSDICVTTLGGGFNYPSGVAVDGIGNVFVGDSGNKAVKEILIGTYFPGTTVASASSSLSFYFTFGSGGQINAPRVLTQGAVGLDFTDKGSGSCTTNGTSHTYNAGDVCKVDVQFKPTHPGPRLGAVELITADGTVIATAYTSGIGKGPQVIYSSNNIQRLLGGVISELTAVAVDGSGNVLVVDTYHNAVEEMPAGCASSACMTTLGGGFNEPNGVAVDGSGNVIVADTENNAVKKMPAGCASSTCVTTLGGGFHEPNGVAVDGYGNVFVADTYNNAVKEMPAGCASSACVTTTLGGGFHEPTGVAVGALGNVFVADILNNAVKEIPVGCTASSCVIALGGGFKDPIGVAVDGIGNVFVADRNNYTVKSMPVGCASSSCVTTLGGGFSGPSGVAVDGSGNVFVADSDIATVTELDFSDAPSLAFASTNVGSTSSDSPRTVTIRNEGNAALTFLVPTTSDNPSISSNFTLDSSSSGTCPLISAGSQAGTLAPGASCTLPVSFTPTSAGSITGSLTLTDDAFVNPQYVQLSGTGLQPQVATTTALSVTPASVAYGQQITLAATVSGAQFDNASPTGTVTFSAGATQLGQVSVTALANSSTAQVTLTVSGTVLGAGSYNILAAYSGDSNYLSSSGTLSFTVNQATPAITWATPAAITYGTALSGTQLDATASVPGAFT